MPRLRRSFDGLSIRMYRIDPWSVHVGFEVDKVALGQVFLPVFRFSPVAITPPVLHTHSHLYVAITRRTNGQRIGFSFGNGGPLDRKVFSLSLFRVNVEPKFVLKCVITEPHRFNTGVGYLTTMCCYWGHLTSRRRGRDEFLKKILHRRVLSAVNNGIHLRIENTKVCLRMCKKGESVGKGVQTGAGTAQCKGLLPRVFACE